MITWNEFNDKMNNRFGMIFKRVDDLYFNVASKMNIGEDIEIEDIQALKYLQDLFPMRGKLYVITDTCYHNGNGPYAVDSGKVDNFVYTYMEEYGEPFFSTDIIIVNFEDKLIWVLFHEGVCWLTKG